MTAELIREQYCEKDLLNFKESFMHKGFWDNNGEKEFFYKDFASGGFETSNIKRISNPYKNVFVLTNYHFFHFVEFGCCVAKRINAYLEKSVVRHWSDKQNHKYGKILIQLLKECFLRFHDHERITAQEGLRKMYRYFPAAMLLPNSANHHADIERIMWYEGQACSCDKTLTKMLDNYKEKMYAVLTADFVPLGPYDLCQYSLEDLQSIAKSRGLVYQDIPNVKALAAYLLLQSTRNTSHIWWENPEIYFANHKPPILQTANTSIEFSTAASKASSENITTQTKVFLPWYTIFENFNQENSGTEDKVDDSACGDTGSVDLDFEKVVQTADELEMRTPMPQKKWEKVLITFHSEIEKLPDPDPNANETKTNEKTVGKEEVEHVFVKPKTKKRPRTSDKASSQFSPLARKAFNKTSSSQK